MPLCTLSNGELNINRVKRKWCFWPSCFILSHFVQIQWEFLWCYSHLTHHAQSPNSFQAWGERLPFHMPKYTNSNLSFWWVGSLQEVERCRESCWHLILAGDTVVFLTVSVIGMPPDSSPYFSLYYLSDRSPNPYSACLNEVSVLNEFLSTHISQDLEGMFTCPTSLPCCHLSLHAMDHCSGCPCSSPLAVYNHISMFLRLFPRPLPPTVIIISPS